MVAAVPVRLVVVVVVVVATVSAQQR